MSIILAKILGLYYLVMGAAFVVNPERVQRINQKLMKKEHLLFLGGAVALFIGATLVSLHNVWVADWPVLITLIGWGSLLKGTGLTVYSGFAQRFASLIDNPKSFWIIGAVLVLLGLFLAYQGWLADINGF